MASHAEREQKLKVPRSTTANKGAAEIPAYQALGQSLSASFLTAVNASQSDMRSVISSLGHRPASSMAHSRASSDCASSCSNLDFVPERPNNQELNKAELRKRKVAAAKYAGCTYSLDDFIALDTVETLLMEYGSASHMGVRDPSYSFFVNTTRTAALYYKVRDKVAIITGDPLCFPSEYEAILDDFRDFCKARHWGVAVMAASSTLTLLAEEKRWVSMRFGTEKVLDPLTNPLILGTGGKRTITQCKKLLKSGTSVQLYCPSYQNDPIIEAEIVRIYNNWRTQRNEEKGHDQCFMTVFDMLALPRLMTYLYTQDCQGTITGFAALRRLGDGFHLDPYIATPSAPKGTTDLLIFASMAFCNNVGISKLSLGFEPQQQLGPQDVRGMSSFMTKVSRSVHKKMWSNLPLEGKQAFFQRWHTDDEQDAELHIIFFKQPGLRELVATTHFANISLKAVVAKGLSKAKEEHRARRSEDSEGSLSGKLKEKGQA